MKKSASKLETAVFTLLLSSIMLVPHAAFAELPPGSYNTLRADAEEALVLTVTAVTATSSGKGSDVVAEADVLSVERSKSGLKKGAHVTLKYSFVDPLKAPGFAGPRQAPLLEKGAVYPAFLNKSAEGTAYELAAYGMSFSMTPEKR